VRGLRSSSLPMATRKDLSSRQRELPGLLQVPPVSDATKGEPMTDNGDRVGETKARQKSMAEEEHERRYRAFIAETQARQERYYAESSAEWFKENGGSNGFPDLEFRAPACPMCSKETTPEDGQFYCDVCFVWWPRTGYGHEAELTDESPHHPAHIGSSGDA
jgi:hypothetical protein